MIITLSNTFDIVMEYQTVQPFTIARVVVIGRSVYRIAILTPQIQDIYACIMPETVAYLCQSTCQMVSCPLLIP